MKHVLKQSDVNRALHNIDFHALDETLYDAIEALRCYALGSIYEDDSVGCHEDNVCFLGVAKHKLIQDIERFKMRLDEYVAMLNANL